MGAIDQGARAMGKRRGFTLVEMVVVVAIAAILALVAFPSVLEVVRQARRADATSALVRLQGDQVSWRGNHVSYTTVLQGNPLTCQSANPPGLCWDEPESAQGYYDIAIIAADAVGFIATASPKGDGPQGNDRCGFFAIDAEGPHYATVAGVGRPADAACWR
jgi:type IV pilus assembly protein PilE